MTRAGILAGNKVLKSMGLPEKRVLAENLKRLRGDRSQLEIAKLAGLNVRNYARLERLDQHANPTFDNLCKIARALRVEPYELIKKQD